MSLEFGYVSTQDKAPDLSLLANADVLAFDIETSGVHTAVDIPYGFSLTSRPDEAYFVHMNNRFFTDLLANEGTLKIAQNAKFDRSMLMKSGVEVNNLCCTMIAAHLLEENRLNLKTLLKRFVRDVDIDIKQFPDFPKYIPRATLQELALHFGPHAAGALMLWNRLQRELRANGLWNVFWNTEMPVVPVLSDMELAGALIDTDVLNRLGSEFDEQIALYEDILRTLSGCQDANFNSPDQAAEILYDQFKVPKPPKYRWTTSGRPSVDKKWLEAFKEKFPVLKYYIAYKEYRHLKDTYVDGILERLVNGRIHTNFNQARTKTGRLSSTDPNLQNIPMRSKVGRQIREAFVAPPGKKIVKPDYIQMELKKMACLSNCKAMLDAFKEDRDIHRETAIRMYKDESRRAEGKTQNFRLIYGGGSEEDQRLLFEAYPEVKTWTESMVKEFEVLGYARTMRGRREHLGNFDRMRRKEIEHAHRAGVSLMDQGSCSEVMKEAMVRVWEQVKHSDVKMLLQVHDELVLECPEKDIKEVYFMLHKEMTFNEMQIPLNIDVSVGKSWGGAEKVTFAA